MNCSHCRDVALDIARGLVHLEEAMALDHVSGCAECSRYLQQQRELTAGLRALAADTDEAPSEAMERRLALAVAVQPAGSYRPHISAGLGRWLEVAAAIVLAAGALAWWQWPSRVAPTSATTQARGVRPPVSPLAERAPEPGGPVDVQATAASNAAPTSAAPAGPEHFVAPRYPARAARPRTAQATAFVPLPAASLLPPFERGEIVRVRIQMASLVSLGFNVQPDAADTTPIDADLLVGQDGQPRAIRLVTNASQASSRSMR
jgi:hypothetical protein